MMSPLKGSRQCRLGHLCAGRLWRNVDRPACGSQPNRRLGSAPPTVPCPSPNHWQASDSSQNRPDRYCCGPTKSFADTRGPIQATLSKILPFAKGGAFMLGHAVADAFGIVPVEVLGWKDKKDGSREFYCRRELWLCYCRRLGMSKLTAKVDWH